MLFVVPDIYYLKNPTTQLYDFCSTPQHISAVDTMFNLRMYDVIPLDVLISPDIVILSG